MNEALQLIYNGLVQTSWIEAVAVIMGIVSVWYSRKEKSHFKYAIASKI